MPIIRRTNNRVGPSNDRVADVARSSIENILDVQSRRYQNAFLVHGFNGILYRLKDRGLSCACSTLNSSAAHRLDSEGKVEKGVLDELLMDTNFGIRPYGTRRAPDEYLAEKIKVDLSDVVGDFMEDSGTNLDRPTGGHQDHYGRSNEDPRVKTVVADGEGPNGPVRPTNDVLDDIEEMLVADSGSSSSTSHACPICFGTGYVGGFDVYQGHRAVFSSATENLIVNGTLDSSSSIPTFSGSAFTLSSLLLPRGVIAVDSLTVWNYDEIVPASFKLDNVAINTENDVIAFCNGLANHTLTATFSKANTRFTHLEIQFNQSENWPLFEFPKLTKNNDQSFLENTDPFTITLSPRIPFIASKDVITESTYGKALLVGSVTTWNTRNRDVLGWEAEVRVVQPMELYNILPRRKILKSPRTPAKVRDNGYGNKRT